MSTNEIVQIIGKELVQEIKKVCTSTGDFEKDKARAENYSKEVGMDQANADMMVVMATEGPAAAMKAMMESCGNDYSLMRSRYG